MAALKICLICFHFAVGPCPVRPVPAVPASPVALRDGLRDFVLNCKMSFISRSSVATRDGCRRPRDQLRGDTDAVSCAPHTALENIGNAQNPAILRISSCFPLNANADVRAIT